MLGEKRLVVIIGLKDITHDGLLSFAAHKWGHGE